MWKPEPKAGGSQDNRNTVALPFISMVSTQKTSQLKVSMADFQASICILETQWMDGWEEHEGCFIAW